MNVHLNELRNMQGDQGVHLSTSDYLALVEALRNSHNYILHVGSSYTMNGQPHPQQMIVDANEAVLAKLAAKQ